MQTESLHKVSEHLCDRHPYLQEPFPRSIFPKEISTAFGHRAFPKLVAVLSRNDLTGEERTDALETAASLLTTQESKVSAVACGMVTPCAECVLTRTQTQARMGGGGDHPRGDSRGHGGDNDAHDVHDEGEGDDDPNWQARAYACVVLASLATISAGKVAIRDSGCLEGVSNMLSERRVECRNNAALVFARLAETADGVSLCVENGSVPVLVDALRDSDVEVVDRCLVSLVACTRVDAGLTAAISADAIPSLLRIIAVDEIAFLAASVISNICTHPQGKKACAEAGAAEALAPLVIAADPEVRRVATGALMHMAICVEGKVAISEFASENLVRALFDDNAHARRNAMRCIRYTSEFREARKDFEYMLSDDPELLAEVFNND